MGQYHVDYSGSISVTQQGYTCQRWDSQRPQNHDIHIRLNFPDTDETLSDAQNFCRNPDLGESTWCYVASGETRWAYCDVPQCDIGRYCVANARR